MSAMLFLIASTVHSIIWSKCLNRALIWAPAWLALPFLQEFSMFKMTFLKLMLNGGEILFLLPEGQIGYP